MTVLQLFTAVPAAIQGIITASAVVPFLYFTAFPGSPQYY